MKTALVLECPACTAKFNLKRYVAEKRIRCRKCSAIVELPALQGQAAEPAAPPRRAAPLLGWAILTGVSLVILMPLGFFSYVAWEEAERRSIVGPPESMPRGPIRLEEMQAMAATMPIPLSRGTAWEYECGGELETQAVVSVVGGDGVRPPEAAVRVRRRSHEETRTYRIERDGVYWIKLDESEFVPPLKVAALPLNMDSEWSGGETFAGNELWSLRFAADGAETITVPAGTFACTRVVVTGARGNVDWVERLWIAKGVGVVKREAPADPTCPLHLLKARSP